MQLELIFGYIIAQLLTLEGKQHRAHLGLGYRDVIHYNRLTFLISKQICSV